MMLVLVYVVEKALLLDKVIQILRQLNKKIMIEKIIIIYNTVELERLSGELFAAHDER